MKVCITGDFLRPEIIDGVARPHQLGNIRWFWELVRKPIELALEQPPTLYFPVEHVLETPVLWASTYDGMAEFITDQDIFIGFELSPALIRGIESEGSRWINLSLHPARYMPDLVFNVSASPSIQGMLRLFAVPTEKFSIRAGVVRSRLSWMPDLGLEDFSLFTGQTWQDASLIEGGRFWGMKDVPSDLWNRTPPVLYKSHPHESSTEFPFAQLTTENVYRLMCQPGCKEVISLSSSALFESEQFGVPAVRLMPKREDRPVPIYGEYLLSPGFWEYLLNLPSLHEIPIQPKVTPNLIRSTLPHRWGDDILEAK